MDTKLKFEDETLQLHIDMMDKIRSEIAKVTGIDDTKAGLLESPSSPADILAAARRAQQLLGNYILEMEVFEKHRLEMVARKLPVRVYFESPDGAIQPQPPLDDQA